jgi:dipeptidase E
METAPRQIVAFGGGGFLDGVREPAAGRLRAGLARAERPRVCFLPSASGDADHYIVRFYRAFSAHRCETSRVSSFPRAYRVSAREGSAAESALPARFLPAPPPAALREDIAEFRWIKSMRKWAGWLG